MSTTPGLNPVSSGPLQTMKLHYVLYNKSFTEPSLKIFEESSLQLRKVGSPAGLNTNVLTNLAAGGLFPSYSISSSPVTKETVITQTFTDQFKITFRNQETFTTITSTSLISTRVTSFITKTQTINPLAGLLG